MQIELETLGTLIFDNSLVYQSKLRPEHFTSNMRQRGYKEIVKLVEAGEKVDPIILKAKLKSTEPIEWYNAYTGASFFESQQKILEDSLRERRLYEITAILKSGYDTQQKMNEISKIISSLENTEGGYKHVKDLIPKVLDDMERLIELQGRCSGIATGIGPIDWNMSGIQNEYVLIGARPSVGKTALALSIIDNIDRRLNIGIFSLEMPASQLVQRLMAMHTKVTGSDLRMGRLKPSQYESISRCTATLEKRGIYINDKPNMLFSELKSEARNMVRKHGVKIIFIDYITLITPDDKKLPRHEQVEEISKGLKQLNRELSVPIVALSQLTRDKDGVRPTLSSLRASGSLEQDADAIIFLHRDAKITEEQRNQDEIIPIELIIAKNRNGSVGSDTISFHQKRTKFYTEE